MSLGMPLQEFVPADSFRNINDYEKNRFRLDVDESLKRLCF